MKTLFSWLIWMEGRAEELYARASAAFSANDRELSGFFKALSVEEAAHRFMIERASGFIKGRDFVSPVTLDEAAMEEMAEHFSKCEKMIGGGPLDRTAFLECVVKAEFSEWNDLFRFAINSFKSESREFVEAAVSLQHHKRRIEEFIEGRGELKDLLDRIRGLPRVWEDSILIVEDDEDIRDLLKEVLYKEGLVDAVSNGREGLEKIEERYYSVIMSDLEMPVMNGIELYKAVSAKYPGIGQRFIFFSGALDGTASEFIGKNGLKWLPKPSTIREIRKAVADILSA